MIEEADMPDDVRRIVDARRACQCGRGQGKETGGRGTLYPAVVNTKQIAEGVYPSGQRR